MGNDSTNRHQVITENGHWKLLKTHFGQIESYRLTYPSQQQYKQNLSLFNKRILPKPNIVKLIHLETTTFTLPCHQYQLIIYTQRIPFRLSELLDLTQQKAWFIIHQSLVGFQQLMNEYQSFYVSDEMICINQKGQIKVWMNQRIEQNEASFPSNKNGGLQEQKLIMSLIEQVEKHVLDMKFFREQINKHIYCLNKITFENVFRAIYDLFSNIQIQKLEMKKFTPQNLRTNSNRKMFIQPQTTSIMQHNHIPNQNTLPVIKQHCHKRVVHYTQQQISSRYSDSLIQSIQQLKFSIKKPELANNNPVKIRQHLQVLNKMNGVVQKCMAKMIEQKLTLDRQIIIQFEGQKCKPEQFMIYYQEN